MSPTQKSKKIGMPSQKSGRSREGSGGPLGSPGGVGWPTRKSGRCREGSGGPRGSPGGVGRLFWKSRRGREAFPDVREVSGVPT